MNLLPGPEERECLKQMLSEGATTNGADSTCQHRHFQSAPVQVQHTGMNWLYAFSHNDPKVAFWGIFPKLARVT